MSVLRLAWRPALGLAAAALVLSLLAPPAGGGAPGGRGGTRVGVEPSAACPGGDPIAASDLPARVPPSCDLAGRTVVDHGVSVVVPEPGSGVEADATTRRGLQRLVVTAGPDGTVLLGATGDDAVAGGAAGGGVGGDFAVTGDRQCRSCPPPCSDGASQTYGFRWPLSNGPMPWFFNRGTTPSSLTPDAAEAALVSATDNIVNANNNCGLADGVDVEAVYEGDTGARANMTKSGGCRAYARRDGKSVIDFGGLPYPGKSCYWFNYDSTGKPTILVEADIRLQRGLRWTTNIAPGCNNRYDLEGLTTHERGHSFGLAHVGSSHGNLTMSTYGLTECSKSYRTLGLGDIRGLESLY